MDKLIFFLAKTIRYIENYIQNIEKIREDKGLSQEYMAMKLGISQSTYTKVERGEVNLYVDRLLKIIKILDVGLAKVFDEENQNVFNVNSYDSSSNTNLQVVETMYNDNKDIVHKLQNTFEEENKHLKEEVTFLRKMLEKKL